VSRFAPALPACSAFLVATILFSICLRNDFVYDDVLLLQMDERITPPSNWSRYLTESYNGGVDNLFRPLVSLSYAVQHYFHGLTRWPYFALNILLHAGCAAAVAELTRRLTSSPRCNQGGGRGEGRAVAPGPNTVGASRGESPSRAPAFLAGLIFATHPVHSEAVASVVGRGETMCALAMLTAMILFCRPLTGARAIAIWACGVVAVLSKEQGLLLPVLLLVQHLLVRAPASKRAGGLLLILLISWTWAGYIIFRENTLKFWWDRSLLDWTQQPMILSTPADRWLWPIAILGRYARLLVFPGTLSIDYGYAVTAPAIGWHDAYLWLGVEAAAVWIVLLIIAWRARHRVMGFLLVAMAVTYAVVSNGPTLIGTIMGERLIYLPSVFFIITAAIALRSARGIGMTLAIVACLGGAVRTWKYVAQFDDRLSFYEKSVLDQPASVKLRILLGSELVNRGRLADAAQVAAEARRRTPDVAELWYQSGYIAFLLRDYDSAETFLNEAHRLHRNPIKAAGLLQQVIEARAATQPAQ